MKPHKPILFVKILHGSSNLLKELTSHFRETQSQGYLTQYDIVVLSDNIEVSTLQEQIIKAADKLAREILRNLEEKKQ